jgi:plasmid stabilization system protein ParE
VDFQVRISEAALADFEEILAYSWANFPNSAERLGNAILNHVDLLKSFPYIGAPLAGHPASAN